MKKIAIIGGGAAGVGALWALRNCAEVHLFEKDNQLGGHAFSHEVKQGENVVPVDLGVEYFNEHLSPNLFALFKLLNIETYIAPLTFSAYSSHAPADNYWSNSRLGGTLNQKFSHEMNRFHSDMVDVAQNKKLSYYAMSIGDFLVSRHYSEDFQHSVLLPMMTTFSGCRAPSLEYSLMYVAVSFSMNLLSFFTPCHWRKIKGGVSKYFKAMGAKCRESIHLSCAVQSVCQQGNQVLLTLSDNQKQSFDAVIFACQAELALKLIRNPSLRQSSLLKQFEYVPITSSLHNDTRVINATKMATEYFQFALADQTRASFAGFLSRINTCLQPYQSSLPLYVSFDQEEHIDSNKLITSKYWKLPKLRPQDLALRKRIRNIQGVNQMWFCGTDFSLTGHEGAFVSGLVIANRLGAAYPFSENFHALAQFNIIRDIMGVYSKPQAFIERLNGQAYAMAKRFNVHKRLSHYYIQEYMY